MSDYAEEIRELLEDFPEKHEEHVDAALYTCAVQRAVDAGMTREEFLAMVSGMFDESKIMGELEDRMSLTRGEA